MLPTNEGAIRLFRFSGIQVYLHWSWFVVGYLEMSYRRNHYSSVYWNAAEYVSLFAIVLMHEFGHALACRQTGGRADQIVLWPLGGVAYASPPPRPGATLWTIAAGPLVNLILLPVSLLIFYLATSFGGVGASSDLGHYLRTLTYINLGLLIFNLLPIYPLDGGQILHALLWFIMGRARSLMVATVIGMFGVVAFAAYALNVRSLWLGVIAFFAGTNCWRGFQFARHLNRLESAPVHAGYQCPACHNSPVVGAFWICQACQCQFDVFVTGGLCPNCHSEFPVTACLRCGAARPIQEWQAPRGQPPPLFRTER